jgi:purine-binding chemotaxis protein CheW
MRVEEANRKDAANRSADGSQYLTFCLGAETYGIDILRVQEIRGYTPATPVPNSTAWVRGVMNLRGTIVPVVDLRQRLGMQAIENGRLTVIIVVNVGTKTLGLVVDSVAEVLTIGDQIQPVPDLDNGRQSAVAKGIAHVDDNLVVLLDLDRLFLDQALPISD